MKTESTKPKKETICICLKCDNEISIKDVELDEIREMCDKLQKILNVKHPITAPEIIDGALRLNTPRCCNNPYYLYKK